MQYINIANERIKGEYHKDRSLVKINRYPFMVYLDQQKEGGAEILYNSIINKNKAVVNPRSFPYINLYLSPYGSIMRKETHHTIFQADIKYTYDIINYAIQKRQNDELLKYLGKVKVNQHILYKLELINKDFKQKKYIIQNGEDMYQIAEQQRIGSYKILELNPQYSYYDSVKDGDEITIQTYYSKSITLYIDVKTNLPYMIKVFDEKGLYESYIFENLQLNYPFAKDEFLEDTHLNS